MSNAGIDQNSRATLTALSNTGDGSIVALYADPVTHRLLTDNTTSAGITSINNDTTAAQLITVGTAGSDVAISNAVVGTTTINIPTASATKRGALSSTDWTTFNNKVVGPVSATANAIALYDGITGKIIKDSGITFVSNDLTFPLGGNLTLQTTTQTVNNTAGDGIYITPSNGLGSGNGGNFYGEGGNGGATGNGGYVEFDGGNGGSTSGTGGFVYLYGGNASGGDSNGGDIQIQAGSKHGGGLDGNITISSGGITILEGDTAVKILSADSEYALLDTSQLTTTDKTFTFPNISGTFVLGAFSSTDNALARFDSTTGKLIQNSNATLDDNGALSLNYPSTINYLAASNDSETEIWRTSGGASQTTDGQLRLTTYANPSATAGNRFMELISSDDSDYRGLRIRGKTIGIFNNAQTVGAIFDATSIASTSKTFTLPNSSGTIALQSAASGTFTTADLKTVTVTNGIITSFV